MDSAHVVRAVMVTRLYSITINPVGGIISLDGSPIENTVTYRWPYLSTHVIEGEEMIQLTEDTRLSFRSWSYGSRSMQREVVVTGDASYSVVWFKEHRVTIKEFDGGFLSLSPGEYWFFESENLEIRAIPSKHHTLGEWIVDGEHVPAQETLLLSIDSPHTLEIIFNANKYPVVIDAAGGLVFLDGMESDGQIRIQSSYGDRVLVKAAESIEFSNSTRLIFVGWSDNVNTAERLLDVEGDLFFRALWEREYYLTVISELGDPMGSGWYVEGTIATFRVDMSRVALGNEVRGVLIDGVFFQEQESEVLMDRPHTIIFDWLSSYQTFGRTSAPVQLDIASLAMLAGGVGMIISTASLGAVQVKSNRFPEKIREVVKRLRASRATRHT